MVDKGKGIADDSSSAKRKRKGDDKSGNRKRKNHNVLQFFEESAFEINDSSEDEDFIDDDISMYFEDVIGPDPGVKAEPKTPNVPLFPKEEEMDEEEMDKRMEERYKPGAGFVKYAEDRARASRTDDWNTSMALEKDPTIWKVKCMVGRERHSVFCLMQKYVDLKYLGTKLQIISAFAVEHMKGFVFIEAERQCDINEACKGLCNIYPTRAAPVPVSDVQHLFAVRSKDSGIFVDTWARVKNGKYKGDLAQVVNVNETKRKATVKLVPRIDLQAVSEKFGGGVTGKKSTIPAPRLITSSELEAYRPLVKERRDRDTGELYEVFDGMCLKDGYLFKKVPLDSLSFWDVRPTETELIKFSTANKEESNDVEWLTGLFGERKKKKPTISNNKGGKGEGSSSSSLENSFEVHDLVFHGRKGFGVVIGREKDDRIKVLEEGSDRHMVVAVEARLLKKAEFDKKFTAFDQHKKIISMNDHVRILEGPLEDKNGIVKQIYKGVVFLHDENESENCGYFCAKAQICEKMESFADLCKGKGGKTDASGFDDFPSSPKSPLSPQKPFEEKADSRNFDRDDKDGFSVGQPCRIRVGPLKGYICRVMAIRYSDITVKLDSQHKILTVKAEHLAELKGKSSGVSNGDGQDSTKPFELLGDGNSEGWMDGGGAPESGGWNTGGQSTERSSWAPFSAPGSSVQPESTSADPSNSDNDANKGVGASAWETKTTQDSIPWGASASEKKSGGWGASSSGVENDTSDNAGWGSAKLKDPVDSSNDAPSWGNAGGSNKSESKSAWNSVAAPATQTSGWGAVKKDEDSAGGWGASASQSGGSSWGKQTDQGQSDGWGTKQAADGENKDDGAGGWGKKLSVTAGDSGKWGSADKEADGGSGWGSNNKDGGSSWSKPADGGGSSWGNQDGKQEGSRGGGGGNACFKCGETGHMSRECPQGGGGGGKGNCFKCGESGHMSRECPKGGGGSGGNACFKCGETGHMSRECPQGGGGGGGGNACFKCGETGHMSRECPQGGGGGGKGNCFKCGESGHMSRECPKGGGGSGGNACFKCGETGHMSRECPQGGGGGGSRNCYKCGESGHMSRECPQGGGGGGGNACFKCGETGHMSRECPQGGGSGGGGGRSCYKCGESGHMSRECPQGGDGGGGGRNCYKCGESGHMSRECPQGGGSGGGRSCYKCGESGHMSRECPQGGGGGGGGGRSCYKCGENGHMSRECPQGGGSGGGSGNCYKCGESGHMSRECPQGGGGGGGRNCYKCGESGHMSRECPQGGGGGRGGSYGGGGRGGSYGGGGWGAGGWGSEKASDAGKKDDGQSSGWSSGWSSGLQTGGGWGNTDASDTAGKKDDAQGSQWGGGANQTAGSWGSDGGKKADAQGSSWGSGGDQSAGKKESWGGSGGHQTAGCGGGGWGSSGAGDKKDDAEGSGWKKSGW